MAEVEAETVVGCSKNTTPAEAEEEAGAGWTYSWIQWAQTYI